MKAKTILLSVALCIGAAAVCHAQIVQMGTWKLNEAKIHHQPKACITSTKLPSLMRASGCSSIPELKFHE
jgi:hypothetical protein